MLHISQQPYYEKLNTPALKSLLPKARELALNRPAPSLSTAEMFCAILFTDKELMHKIEQRYNKTANDLVQHLAADAPPKHGSQETDELAELPASPRLDYAISSACLNKDFIEPKDILRYVLKDECNTDLIRLLQNLDILPHSQNPFSLDTDQKIVNALRDFSAYLLGAEDNSPAK